jgi:hypothetical protein
VALAAREVRGPGELQFVVEHSEQRVAFEVDVRDVAANGLVRQGQAESQAT